MLVLVHVIDVLVRNSLSVVKNLVAVEYVHVVTDLLLMGITTIRKKVSKH